MEGLMGNSSRGARTEGVVIIPVYNEEKNIRAVLEEIRREGIDWDIVAVDDGSTDRSGELLGEMDVIRISHPVNLGYGAAVQTGLRYAVKEGYGTVVLMDGDGQHVPSEIPKLLRGVSGGADIVIGSRLLQEGGGYSIPLMRRIGISFFSSLARILGGTKIFDVTSGFQAMRRPVAEFLAEEYPVDFPDAEVIISLGLKKFRIAEIPTVVRRREHGTSMYANPAKVLYYPFKSLLASFIVLLRLIRKKS
jgi:glycosyltransferase involved in cell wall biosynthesis